MTNKVHIDYLIEQPSGQFSETKTLKLQSGSQGFTIRVTILRICAYALKRNREVDINFLAPFRADIQRPCP